MPIFPGSIAVTGACLRSWRLLQRETQAANPFYFPVEVARVSLPACLE